MGLTIYTYFFNAGIFTQSQQRTQSLPSESMIQQENPPPLESTLNENVIQPRNMDVTSLSSIQVRTPPPPSCLASQEPDTTQRENSPGIMD